MYLHISVSVYLPFYRDTGSDSRSTTEREPNPTQQWSFNSRWYDPPPLIFFFFFVFDFYFRPSSLHYFTYYPGVYTEYFFHLYRLPSVSPTVPLVLCVCVCCAFRVLPPPTLKAARLVEDGRAGMFAFLLAFFFLFFWTHICCENIIICFAPPPYWSSPPSCPSPCPAQFLRERKFCESVSVYST